VSAPIRAAFDAPFKFVKILAQLSALCVDSIFYLV
jgi:hypothetical protein